MRVNVKVYPIAGVSDATQEMEVALTEGNLNELMTLLQERLGAGLCEKSVMILYNGQALDLKADVVFSNGDQLWVMPCISGG